MTKEAGGADVAAVQFYISKRKVRWPQDAPTRC